MADIYVKSTAGGSATGADWTNAFLTSAAAAAVDTAGDTIYYSQAHSESTASALSLSFAGTLASPTKLIGVSDAAIPPTDISSTAIIATTGASSITLAGEAVYAHGLIFQSGSSTSTASFLRTADESYTDLRNCKIQINNSSASSRITFGSVASASQSVKVALRDTFVKFGAAGQYINCLNADLTMEGGGIESGSTTPTYLFTMTGSGNSINVTGADFSALSAGVHLLQGGLGANGKAMFRGIKLPDAWSGGLFASPPSSLGQRAEMHNYSVGSTKYQLLAEDYAGVVSSNATIYRSGGASDGDASYSFKLVANANASYPVAPLVSPELPAVWNSATVSKTVTVEILHDSTTALTDAEVWLEVLYLGTSGTLLQSVVSDCKASIVATAADQTTSTATWTTPGLTNPNKQKLSVTITPQAAGYIQARVCLAKASKTVYVDPKLTVA